MTASISCKSFLVEYRLSICSLAWKSMSTLSARPRMAPKCCSSMPSVRHWASSTLMDVLQTEYTYEPFGATTATGTASTNPFQYTGRENDATGLYNYRARYYSPTSAAIHQRGSARYHRRRYQFLYAYARTNSPTNFTLTPTADCRQSDPVSPDSDVEQMVR